MRSCYWVCLMYDAKPQQNKLLSARANADPEIMTHQKR